MSGKHLQNRSEGFNSIWLRHKFSTITQAVFKQPRMRLKRRQALQKFLICEQERDEKQIFAFSLENQMMMLKNSTLNSCENKKIN